MYFQLPVIDILVCLLFIVLGTIGNSAMDTLDFHYSTSRFDDWDDGESNLSKFLAWWAGKDSHRNKYALDASPVGFFMGPLLRGPLVFLTQAWHFGKWVMLTGYQTAILVLAFDFQSVWEYLVSIIIFKILVGGIFELFYQRVWREKEASARPVGYQTPRSIKVQSSPFRSFLRDHGILVSVFFIIGAYVLSYGVYTWAGGCLTTQCLQTIGWTPASTAAISILAVSLGAFYFMQWWTNPDRI